MGFTPSLPSIRSLSSAVVGSNNSRPRVITGGVTGDVAISQANVIIGRDATGAGPAQEIPCTAFARTFLDDTTQATARTTLGLGTGDSPTFTGLTLSGGSIILDSVQAKTSSGLVLKNVGGSSCLTIGQGGGCVATFADGVQVTGVLQANSTTDCTAIGTAGTVVAGGLSVAKQLRVGEDISLTGGKYIYLRGDASTNGSVRIRSQSDNNALIESRIGGNWVTMENWSVS